MDLTRAINHLRWELEQIDLAIEHLTALQDSPAPYIVKRGRKSMNEAERQEVSERMRKYWAQRRQARALAAAGA